MEIKNKKVMIIASVIIIIMICVAFTSKTFQNDTFYSIKVGESILKHGIDMKDHFSWHSLSYTYPHWLFDIGIYKLYQFGGFTGLYISTIIIFSMIGILFYFVYLKRNKSYFLSLFFSILAVIMTARFAVARAQLITYMLFLIEIFAIEKLLDNGHKRYMVILGIICILVANIHAAVWPFYFILMLPYLVSHLLACLKEKIHYQSNFNIFASKLEVKKYRYIRYLFIMFLLGLLLGLATPIGDTPYTYFIKIMMGDTTQYIDEHKALVLIDNLFVIGYLVILLFSLIFTKVKVKLADFLMIGGLVFMTFISTRHMAFLGIIGMFYLCRIVCSIGKIYSKYPLDYDLPFYGIFIVTISIIVTSSVVYSINSKDAFVDVNKYPVTMVDWMNEKLDLNEIKLYNDYDFGSYLIYRNIPVYIDSRSDLYTKPFNGKRDIFDECMDITTNYGRVFKKYNVTHILIYKNTYLNQILAVSSNYELVHKDGYFMLYKYLGNEESK